LLFITPLLFIALHSAQAENQSSVGDSRQLVSMPEETRGQMREEMLDHLSALNELIGHLANSDLDAVATVAETRMGKSSMGKHRATGMGPGKYMPEAMRNIGFGMHAAASELSQVAKEGDLQGAYGALQKITSACVACHYSFRIR
jgi:hypothetical protein